MSTPFPCKMCGCTVTPENRAENRRICKDCNKKRMIALADRDREKKNSRQREYVANNLASVQEKDRKRGALNAEARAEYQRQHRWTPAGILTRLKRAAHTKGLEFNLTAEDIIIPDVCPVLGIPLDSSVRERTPSVDRIDNDLGYVRGNVCVISLRANRVKSDSTPEEIEAIASYVKRHFAK